nr:pilus assembly protein N-terminal domain-containing protein [Vibrio hippocampi]
MLVNTSMVVAAERYITLDEATHISLSAPISKVFISNPNIADYKIINDNTLVVFARQVGQTRLIVYGVEQEVLLSDKVLVDLDLAEVRKQIKFHYPELNIKLTSIGEKVAVSGVVESEQQRDDIYRLVANLLGREMVTRYESSQLLSFESDSGDMEEPQSMIFARNMTWDGIIEKLTINTLQQVNVKVSVAQVTENFSETVGIDWSSAGQSVGEFLFEQFHAPDISTLISALADDSVAQILAEPNLTVLSGESASFLVGGEVPVIVTSDGSVNISFKEYGIKLDLTAKVMSEQKIRMQLAPEVSEVEAYIEASGIEVPQLASRRAMTTIELADGDSFVLGGLMNSTDYEQLQKMPIIGDIPVFGAAFRKSITERKRTELIIVATVNLVKPSKATELQLPTIRKTSTLARWLNLSPNKQLAPQIKGQNSPQDATQRLLSQGGFIE